MGRIVNISGTEIKDHGIRVLADYVKKNLPDEYTLVLGCKPYTSDVDGVLIGKGSIFAIEVKNWKGKIKARSYGLWEKDGTPVDNPLSQARNNAVALAKWLRNRIGQNRLSGALGSPRKLWVRSLLVFTNPKCSMDATGLDGTSNTRVSIMSLDSVKDFVMQQRGDERVGQMVRDVFDSLNAEVRSLINKETRKGGIVALVIASIAMLLCGVYLIWSQSPDKTAAFIPLSFFVLLAIFGVATILGFINPRRRPYYKHERCGFSSPNTFNPIDYGHADAVLTNYIMDFDRD